MGENIREVIKVKNHLVKILWILITLNVILFSFWVSLTLLSSLSVSNYLIVSLIVLVINSFNFLTIKEINGNLDSITDILIFYTIKSDVHGKKKKI